jgi:hypothetical protein
MLKMQPFLKNSKGIITGFGIVRSAIRTKLKNKCTAKLILLAT